MYINGGGRVVRRCWVNFQCRDVLLLWIIVGQGPIALAVGADGDIFSLVYHFSPLSPSLWETARYRLKYCLKGPLNPSQPTNQMYINNIWCLVNRTEFIVDVEVVDKLDAAEHGVRSGSTMICI